MPQLGSAYEKTLPSAMPTTMVNALGLLALDLTIAAASDCAMYLHIHACVQHRGKTTLPTAKDLKVHTLKHATLTPLQDHRCHAWLQLSSQMHAQKPHVTHCKYAA